MGRSSAEVVIIGAGVLGCAIAYHLAGLGMQTLVLERLDVAQGSTARAAGLLTRVRAKSDLMALVRATYEDLERLQAETGEPLGARRTGSLHVGASPDAKAAHRAMMDLAAAGGEAVRWIGAREAMAMVPWLRLRGDEEVFSTPGDAYIDGHALAWGYARAARARGARILVGEAVLEVQVERGRATGVRTAGGVVAAGAVVVAAGPWSNLLAWGAGAPIPMAPVRSHYWITAPDRRFPPDMPFLVLPDARAYTRPEVGALLVGLRESRSVHADPRTLPEDLRGHVVAGDPDGWSSLEEGAPGFGAFFPGFGDVAIAHYVSGYSMYVPDGRSAVGRLPGVEGLFSGAGCSGGVLALAGGLGQGLAAMIAGAGAQVDLAPHDPARFGAFDPFSPEWGRRCADARSRKTSG
jgi:4-methylaminobutanoate oxidase (formaldehyde-forming)